MAHILLADYQSNRYQNHCIPQGDETSVTECVLCMEPVEGGGFQAAANNCNTRWDNNVSDFAAEISSQKYYYSKGGPQEVRDRRTRFENRWSESQIEPFFETVSMEGASTAEGLFKFDNGDSTVAASRGQCLTKVNPANVIGAEYVEAGVNPNDYPMYWFNFELHFDVYGAYDNQFKVEISLCGQHEESLGAPDFLPGASLYGTIAHEGSRNSKVTADGVDGNTDGNRAQLRIIHAAQNMSRVLEGDGTWETLWSGWQYSTKVHPIVDPKRSTTVGQPSRPVMLFGRRDQVWKIRVTGDTHDDDTNTGNKWKCKMYLTNAQGVRQ